MSKKSELLKTLERLIGDADEQTQLFRGAQERLYLTLSEAYLWWREASSYDRFLEEIYERYKLITRGKEENFTRLVRLIWQLDWGGHEAPKLQNWARSLRGMHHEYETNKDAYAVDQPQLKLTQFIRAQGGIGAVGRIVSPLQNTDEEEALDKKRSSPKKRSETEILNEQQILAKHVELGEIHFAQQAPYIENIVSKTKPFHVNRKGYAVALIRQNANGKYNILSVTSNQSLVQNAIIETYKRNDDALPPILRTISESIKTQTLPIQFEKHRQALNEPTDVLGSDGRTKLTAVKRLLFRPKTKDIVLSECRTDCSVVTVVKPNRYPSSIDEPITLRAVNHKYIEQNMLQTRDLCFHTTLTKQIEVVKDSNLVASHRLRTKNNVTDKIHTLYFYKLSTQVDGSKRQANLDIKSLGAPTWRASVNKDWIDDLQSICVENWLREYGGNINRDRYKQVKLKLSKSFEIAHDGTRNNYSKLETDIPKPKVDRGSKSIEFHVRSKDIFTVFNSLTQQDFIGDIELAANEHVFTISFKTSNASYVVAVPTCNDRGHLDKTAFKAYEG